MLICMLISKYAYLSGHTCSQIARRAFLSAPASTLPARDRALVDLDSSHCPHHHHRHCCYWYRIVDSVFARMSSEIHRAHTTKPNTSNDKYI